MPALRQTSEIFYIRISQQLKLVGIGASPAAVRYVWQRHGLVVRYQRLLWLERKTAELGGVLTEAQQVPALNRQLRSWEKTYNCIRPHQSLAYLAPLEFITRWKRNLRKVKCH